MNLTQGYCQQDGQLLPTMWYTAYMYIWREGYTIRAYIMYKYARSHIKELYQSNTYTHTQTTHSVAPLLKTGANA